MTNSSEATGDDRLRITTVARLTVEIVFEDTASWSGDCSLGQLHRDAQRAAEHKLGNLLKEHSTGVFKCDRIVACRVTQADINLKTELQR